MFEKSMEISSDWYYKQLGYDDQDVPEDSIDDKDDDWDPFFDEKELEKEWEEEARAFESIPKHGVHAHAYKKSLSNMKMKKLRKKGYTYRQIAEQLDCSPSTVRNRLKKFG